MSSSAREQLKQIHDWTIFGTTRLSDLVDKFISDVTTRALMVDEGIVIERIQVSIDECSNYKVDTIEKEGKTRSPVRIRNIQTVTSEELICCHTLGYKVVYFRVYLEELVRKEGSCWFVNFAKKTLQMTFREVVK